MIIEFIFLLEDPENCNYFPTCEENNQMYEIFKSDRQTYFMIANQISGNGLGAPGGGDQVSPEIDQQYQIEFDRLEADFKRNKIDS